MRACLPRLAALSLLAIALIPRLVALVRLPLLGDEPDDLWILATDAPGLLEFFEAPDAYEFEQARLPFFLSYPVLVLFGFESIVPLRLFFFLVYLGFLYSSYKLALEFTGRVMAAWAYVFAIATSCFLASFSIFAITTSDNLFLLLHALSIYLFLQGVKGQSRDGVFRRFLLFSLAAGLCVASKLFGVFLLVALFAYHLLQSRGAVAVGSVSPTRVIGLGLLFIAALTGVNVAPLPSSMKLAAVLVAGTGYAAAILALIRREEAGRFEPVRVPFLVFWTAVVLTAFNFALLFSPPYLNFRNLVEIFGWFGVWPKGFFVLEANWYDMILVVLMKLGAVSTMMVTLVAGIYLWAMRDSGAKGSHGWLFVFVFLVHLVAISASPHHVTWYPLAIFPFIFLFVVSAWAGARDLSDSRIPRIASHLIAACFFVMIADNAYRYGRWYPYGHFDGAQYGNEYVGWNRAGFVSFEAIPDLFAFFVEQREAGPVLVDCKLVYVPLYNEWAAELIEEYFQLHGVDEFSFRDLSEDDAAGARYLLTSPIYGPAIEEELTAGESQLERIRTISLKGLDMVSIWRRSH